MCKKGKVRVRGLKFSEAIEVIKEKSNKFKGHICDIASCKQSMSMNSTMICTTFLKKSTAIGNALVSGGKLKALITDKNTVNVLNKRINERNRNASLLFNREENHRYCLNNTKLMWDRVFDEIIDLKNSNTGGKVLSPDDLEKVAIIYSSNLVTFLKEIDVPLERPQIEEIIAFMPILYLANKNNGVFINLHEFIYMPGSLEYLLSPDTNTNNINLTDTNSETFETLTDNNEGAKLAGGQPSLVSKFSELVDVTANFIKKHGFSAKYRRHNETTSSSGVTIKQVCDHLLENVPGLLDPNISLTTVRRLFNAPNKGYRASARCKGHVNCRIGIKDNSYREFHPDAHYLFARNKQRRELAALFTHETAVLSIDDMAKVKVGAPALSRYHQIKRFFPNGDMPNLNDHDFPVPGYLLNISGYMFLEVIIRLFYNINNIIFEKIIFENIIFS